MNKKNKSFLVFAIAILAIGILAVLLFNFSNKNKKVNNSSGEFVVNISCNLPITGPIATYGEAVRDGVKLAMDDLKNDLERDSIELKFDFKDNKGETKTSVSIFQSQSMSSPDIYMSGVTAQTMAVLDQVAEKNIPHFLWSFTPLFLSEADNNFRTWVNFGVECTYYFDYVNAKKPKKVAIIYTNLEGAVKQFEEVIIPVLKDSSIAVYSEVYELGKSDFKDIATKVKSFKPDLILLEGFKSHMIGLVRDFTSYELLDNKGNAMFAFDLLDAAEDLDQNLLEGLVVTSPLFEYSYDNTEIQNWRNRFKAKYNRFPRYTDAYAYDMAYILYEAAKKVKKGKPWKEAIHLTKMNGITGPLEFNPSGELKYSLSICEYRNGKLQPLDL